MNKFLRIELRLEAIQGTYFSRSCICCSEAVIEVQLDRRRRLWGLISAPQREGWRGRSVTGGKLQMRYSVRFLLCSWWCETKLLVLKVHVRKTRFIVMNRNRTRALGNLGALT
jgi:hypothetical protein